MDANVRDCLVTGYECLIPALVLPDPDDAHVLAAAVHGGANIIVTFNLKDFPAAILAPHGIEAQHPDEFITNLIGLNAPKVIQAVRGQRAGLRNPPRTADELLDILLQQQLPETVRLLRRFKESL
jgi:hypothetical protein